LARARIVTVWTIFEYACGKLQKNILTAFYWPWTWWFYPGSCVKSCIFPHNLFFLSWLSGSPIIGSRLWRKWSAKWCWKSEDVILQEGWRPRFSFLTTRTGSPCGSDVFVRNRKSHWQRISLEKTETKAMVFFSRINPAA
jgi:hypothetical protein